MNPYPTDYENLDAATLKAIHRAYCEHSDLLNQDMKTLDAEIHKVCEKRVYLEYGVREGSIVSHPHIGEELTVRGIRWFHGLRSKPSLLVQRCENDVTITTDSNWELVKS